MKSILALIVFSTFFSYAQIDTSVYYPLHIGDKWEYYFPGEENKIVEIIGDTLMPNGHKYFIFNENAVYAWQYQRVEDVTKVYYYSLANGNEYLLFDFLLPEKIIWSVSFSQDYWGLYKIWSTNDNIVGTFLENREFNRVNIDSTVSPPDTIWNPTVDIYPTLVTKYLGVSSYIYWLQELVGAYINGIGYGTLVDVKETNEETPNDFTLYQNYPNPFNSSTKINFNLNKSAFISLKVYNMLGQEATVLDYGYKQAGNHSVLFEATNLPSGTYMITLSTDGQTKSIKAIILK